MRRGSKFDGKRFIWSKELEQQEMVQTTCEEVTIRKFGAALNSVTKFLKFTFETEEDFKDRYIPTLDTKIKVDPWRNRYVHTYYEKPMNCKWVLPFRTAMDPGTKRQIQSNEMLRRLLRVDPKSLDDHISKVVNDFNRKLIFSGYPWLERIRILEGGISNYMLKREKSGPLYQEASATLAKRNLAKLTSKTN